MDPIGLGPIGQIAVNVKDPERALAFYRDALRLPLAFQAGPMAFFDCAGVRLMLSPPSEAEFDHPSSVLYFTVDDLEAAHAALSERGVEFRSEPRLVHRAADHELWMAFFRDTEGNTLALMATRPLA